LKKILVKGTLFKQSSTTDIANIKDKKRRTYRDDYNKVHRSLLNVGIIIEKLSIRTHFILRQQVRNILKH